MVRISITFLLFLISTRVQAQFASINIEKHPSSMNVVQIDNRENSTLVFIEYTRENEDITWINIHEKTFARVHGSNREFHLINSINLPINSESENRYMLFDKIGQKHAFVLEFEKIPDVSRFTIIENESIDNALNFYEIKTDTTNISSYRNIDDYVAPYPVKEMVRYADNGNIITYIKYKGIIITTSPQVVKQYGKYYTINLSIQNLSGRSILFDPSKIYAKGWTQKKKKKKMFDMKVLSALEYDKKVAKKQAWNNFWVAVEEGMAASQASQSSSTTTYSESSYTSRSANTSGYVGNTYGYANTYGSAYTTTFGQSHTTTYDGAAAYAAQQQANANYNAYANSQNEIREKLSDRYVKLNTIRNEVEFSGYFNIKYKKLDHLIVTMIVDGETFEFTYSNLL